MPDMWIARIISSIRVGADSNHGVAKPITECIDRCWRDMVVETAVIIPGENNHSRCPGRAIHHRIDLLYRPVLSRTDRTVPSTMFVQWAWWHKPAKGGECIVCRVACKLLPGHIICPRGPVSVLAESVQA